MSSRRKSTTPCMISPLSDQSERSASREGRATTCSDDSDDDITQTECFPGTGVRGGASSSGGGASSSGGGYECKYCSFQTSDLNLFTSHVDSAHPTIITTSSYVCVECNYATRSYDSLQVHNSRCHPLEDSFTRTLVTRNNQTIIQQTINDLSFSGAFVRAEEEEPNCPTPLSRAIASRGGAEPPHAAIKPESDSDDDYDSKEMPVLSPAPVTPATPLTPIAAATPSTPVTPGATTTAAAPCLVSFSQSLAVNSVNKGDVGGGVLASGTLAQVLTALQGQTQSSSPQTQLLIPVTSIPSYPPSLDQNLLLLSAFNRFPYPLGDEILRLSSQTKFSEEQIKVWFSAQRLKRGVSWTPEEVDEARRSKVNGAVQAPPTITVIPASLAANGLQSLFQTCHIVGQPGLVLTQIPPNPNALPVTLTVNQPLANPPLAAADPAHTQTETASGLDQSPVKPKKSKEQLLELKASYGRRPFATEAEISRLMQATKLSKRAIKKWFSDTRYNQRNSRDHHGPPPPDDPPMAGSGTRSDPDARTRPEADSRRRSRVGAIVIDSGDDTDSASTTAERDGFRATRSLQATRSRSPASRCRGDLRLKFPKAFPDFTLQRFKEKTVEQRLQLELSFKRSSQPSDEELSRLRTRTKLTLRELQAWFSHRRRLPQGRVSQQPSKDSAPSPPPDSTSSPPARRKVVKKSVEQLQALKRAFIRSQWPTAAEYERLSADTGLPRSHIVNWFGDTRYSAKNSALKWYYLYHSGQGDEALKGGSKKKSRKRFRGRSQRRRNKKTSPDFTSVKVKSGRWFLKDYFRRRGALSESDLDELVSKSGLSYELVRDWFKEVQTREEQGLQAFSEDSLEEDQGNQEESLKENLDEDKEDENLEEENQEKNLEEENQENEEEAKEVNHEENISSEENSENSVNMDLEENLQTDEEETSQSQAEEETSQSQAEEETS